MVKDVLAMGTAIVILTAGMASTFWEVVLFGQRVTGTQTVALAQPAETRAAAKATGSVQAIDRNDGTLTLATPGGSTLTLAVRDIQSLDAVRTGEPVVATYYEALVTQLRPAATRTKTGDLAAARDRRHVTVTATVAAVDGTNGMLTIKGLEGGAETLRVLDPKMLTGVKTGDLVQLTVTPAFAVSLDKPTGI